jgi:hypothetical protein
VAGGADWVVEYGVFEEEGFGFLVEGMSSCLITSDMKLTWGSITMSSQHPFPQLSLLRGSSSSLRCNGLKLLLIGGVMM